MQCPRCGNQNPPGAPNCMRCGTPLGQVPGGYAQPGQYGPGAPGAMANIPNYLVWAILSTLCCCLPFGIVAIVFAAQVNSKLAMGDIAGAMDSSRKAKMWTMVSAGCGLLVIVLYIIVLVVNGGSFYYHYNF